MAVERSYFNCIQCCNLEAQLRAYQQDDTSPGVQSIRLRLEQHQDTARGRALLSIEEESIFGNSTRDGLIVSEGRAVCLECNASQPSLALYLNEKFPQNFC